MASTFERVFYALGKGVRAAKDSAQARLGPDAPPAAAPEPEGTAIINLVKCPRCGTYGPADQTCRCTLAP